LWLSYVEECWLLVKLEYCAYFASCFILFFYGTRVVSVHLFLIMELYVDFPVNGIKKCEFVLI